MILSFFYPFPFDTLLENLPVYSEALLNEPVYCVLLGVSGAWWYITFKGWPVPRRAPCALVVGAVFEITKESELEYPPALRTLHVNTALRVAIDRFQCIRVLQALLVSVISTDDSRRPFFFAAQSNSFAWLFRLLLVFSFSIFFLIQFDFFPLLKNFAVVSLDNTTVVSVPMNNFFENSRAGSRSS